MANPVKPDQSNRPRLMWGTADCSVRDRNQPDFSEEFFDLFEKISKFYETYFLDKYPQKLIKVVGVIPLELEIQLRIDGGDVVVEPIYLDDMEDTSIIERFRILFKERAGCQSTFFNYFRGDRGPDGYSKNKFSFYQRYINPAFYSPCFSRVDFYIRHFSDITFQDLDEQDAERLRLILHAQDMMFRGVSKFIDSFLLNFEAEISSLRAAATVANPDPDIRVQFSENINQKARVERILKNINSSNRLAIYLMLCLRYNYRRNQEEGVATGPVAEIEEKGKMIAEKMASFKKTSPKKPTKLHHKLRMEEGEWVHAVVNSLFFSDRQGYKEYTKKNAGPSFSSDTFEEFFFVRILERELDPVANEDELYFAFDRLLAQCPLGFQRDFRTYLFEKLFPEIRSLINELIEDDQPSNHEKALIQDDKSSYTIGRLGLPSVESSGVFSSVLESSRYETIRLACADFNSPQDRADLTEAPTSKSEECTIL